MRALSSLRQVSCLLNPLSWLYVTNVLSSSEWRFPKRSYSSDPVWSFPYQGSPDYYLSGGLKMRFNFQTIQGGSCGVSFTALLTPGPAQIEFYACLLICLWQPLGVSRNAVWVQRLTSFLAPPSVPASFLSGKLLLLGLSKESAPHPCWLKPPLSNAKPPTMFTGQSPDKRHCCALNNNIF